MDNICDVEGMDMVFKERLPLPTELKNHYPISEKLAKIKKRRDSYIESLLLSFKTKDLDLD